MDTKNVAPNRPIDGTKFLELLTTVSLNEVLRFEFRNSPSQKWETMVFQQDEGRKYQCNFCSVVQWGEKNLFSHLSGKKHNTQMISIPQLQIRIKSPGVPKQAAGNNNRINSPSVSKNPNPSNINKPLNKNVNNAVKPAAGNSAQKEATPNASGGGGNNQANKTLQSPGMKKGPNTNKNTGGSSNPGQKAQPQVKPQSQAGKPNPQQKAQSQPQRAQPQQKAQAPQKTAQDQTKPPQGQQRAQQGETGGQQSNSKNLPNIVKNPLATKISCVPLANLIGGPVSNNASNNDVIIIDEDQPEEGNKNLAGPKNHKPNQVGPTQTAPKQAASNQAATKQAAPNQAAAKQATPNQTASKKNMSNQGSQKHPMANQAGPKQKPNPPNQAGSRYPVPVQKLPNKNAVGSARPVPTEKVITPSPYGGPSVPRSAPSYAGTTNKPGSITFDSNSHQDEIMKLVGVEYVLKIVRSLNDLNIRYLCCLCEITVTEQSMHNHLLGYNHRLKYFDKHYPTAMRQYRQYVSNVPESDVCKIMMPILDKLALAIETHHGRKTPLQCYEHFFAKDRQSLISKAFNRWHASEKVGPSFTHVVDVQEVDELIMNARISTQGVMNMENPNPYMCPTFESQPQAPNYAVGYQNMNVPSSASSRTVDDETHKRMVANFLRDTRQSSGDNQKSRGSKRSRSKSPNQRSGKRVATNPMKNTLWNLDRYSVSPLRDGDIWQAYRHMVDMKVRELNTSFVTYKADPEQHPNYQTEWQMFWKRRKDELILAGINHRSYNFQNEWIYFFNNRLEELYDQEIENIKIKCRERLCLPMTNHELPNKKYHVNVSEPAAAPVTNNNNPVANKDVQKMSVDEEPVAPPNVIHVLRLLTALEDYLGSLGPFVTEMLAKALQIQKLYPEQIQSLTLTTENCAILETAKEKFTGLLISQIYDPAKERALKKAISDTELLLEVAHKYNKPKDTSVLPIIEKQIPPITNRIQQNVEKPLDKTELAAKLASSLVSQGKTSINREELQKILQVYTMIEQKKRHDVVDTPNNFGNQKPSNSENHLPSNSGNCLPSDSGNRLPSTSGNHQSSNFGNHLSSNSGNHLPRDSGNYTSNFSGISVAPERSTISNPINNDSLFAQHSDRNLNDANTASNATSMYTGQNYSSNVARFNNQNTNSIANTTSAFSADRGPFGSGVLSSSSSSYQSGLFGTGTSTMNPTSSVLRHDFTTSSLFNFNTNLNPTYNNNNTSRRNF
ncbi:uncharacterized protein LOC110191376 [Drosophila serrata]|uniref:uncharacterized protein LOC110191376 n=1 Tax=Drosophila serrata TaxID=7274 RepID=UPI000A1D2178|nr:uncharacterized protein LOC110191376 [Drosophila serrata]